MLFASLDDDIAYSRIAHEAHNAVNIVFQLKMGETVRARYTRLTSVCTEHQQIN